MSTDCVAWEGMTPPQCCCCGQFPRPTGPKNNPVRILFVEVHLFSPSEMSREMGARRRRGFSPDLDLSRAAGSRTTKPRGGYVASRPKHIIATTFFTTLSQSQKNLSCVVVIQDKIRTAWAQEMRPKMVEKIGLGRTQRERKKMEKKKE